VKPTYLRVAISGLLDRRRRRGLRRYDARHGRGDDVVAAQQRNRAVIPAPPQ